MFNDNDRALAAVAAVLKHGPSPGPCENETRSISEKLTSAFLTVDTTTLAVNPTSHMVGIGTLTPTHMLNVVGGVNITGNIIANLLNITTDAYIYDDLIVTDDTNIGGGLTVDRIGAGGFSPTDKFLIAGLGTYTGSTNSAGIIGQMTHTLDGDVATTIFGIQGQTSVLTMGFEKM